MDERLARSLADRQELVQLAWRYGMQIEIEDIDGWVALFTSDVEFSFRSETVRVSGSEELGKLIRSTQETDKGPYTHLMTNVVIDLDPDDPDRATGRTTGVIYFTQQDGAIVTRGVHYDDEYRRGPDGWRFSRRSHHVDWNFPSVVQVQS